MSDKKKLDDEIEQELDDRLENSQDISEDDDDFTVKVHRQDYTVKRRFYDKGKALETADSLRMDKKNVVEDNIDHDFVTLVEEEDDVDWDKLVDGGLNFYPPISDAAEKKLDDASNVANELAAESARVESELDKTMTMSSKKKIDYPKIEPKSKSAEKNEDKLPDIAAAEIEDDDLDETGLNEDVVEEGSIDEDDIIDEEEFDDQAKTNYGKTGGPAIKIMALCVVILAVAGLYYFLIMPSKEPKTVPVVQKKSVVKKKIVKTEKPVSQPVPVVAVEKAEPVKVEAMKVVTVPEPVMPVDIIPEIAKYYPYTIHISSYKSEEKAASEVARIRKKGYNAFSAFIQIPGKGGWRRIYAGYFENYQKATAALHDLKTKLREDAIVAKTLFGVQLGSIAKKKDLAEVEKRLQAKGYSVYYMPIADDGLYFRLIAGAYKKEADASGLLKKLIEDGFNAEIVKR